MSNQVYISQDANEVNLVNTDKQLVITEVGNGTSVNVTQPITSVITVASIGPQGQPGPTGPQGPSGSLQPDSSGSFGITGSLMLSGSNPLTVMGPVVFTGSLNVTQGITGSLLGTATNALTASYTTNISGGSAGYVPLWKTDSTLGTSSIHQDDGNVGIGILLPEAKLHVKGPGSTDLYTSLLIQNSNGNPSFVVLGSGHVGIENLAPAYELDVTGTGRFTNGLLVTGSLRAPSITGSVEGTASVAVSSSYALTASYAANVPVTASYALSASFATSAQTASYILNAVSSSYALSASYLIGQSPTSSYALTASYLNPLNQDVSLTGNLTINGTASINYLNVSYESASIIYSSGSNQFGDAANDTQTLYGTVAIPTGSLTVTGSQAISGSVTATGTITGQVLKSADSLGRNVTITGTNNTTINWSNGQFDIQNSGTTVSRYSGAGGTGYFVTKLNINVPNVITDLGAALGVRGSGATSSTTALLVQNSNASASLAVLDNGNVGIGTTTPAYTLDVNGTARLQGNSIIKGSDDTNQNYSLTITNLSGTTKFQVGNGSQFVRFDQWQPIGGGSSVAWTAGGGISIGVGSNTSNQTYTGITCGGGQSGTSTAGSFISLNLTPTINQTGASGAATRGIYINPTLTSAYDFRAIETTSGSVIFGGNTRVTVTGSLNLTGALTASSAVISGDVIIQGTASVNTLIVNQTQLSTGSNQLGDAVNDTQTLYGTVIIPTGSLTVTGSQAISGSLTANNGNLIVNSGSIFVNTSNTIKALGYTTAPFYVGVTNGKNIGFTYTSAATIISLDDGNTAVQPLQFRASSFNFTDTSGLRISNTGYGNTPSAMLHVVGSGTTSSTTSLLVQDGGGGQLLKLQDDGKLITSVIQNTSDTFRNSFNEASLTIGNRMSMISNTGIDFQWQNFVQGNFAFTATANTNNSIASTKNSFYVAHTFNDGAASTLNSFRSMAILDSINMTTYPLTTYTGLYISPTVSSSATTVRAIHTTTGSVIFDGGSVGIGTTSPAYKLDISGSGRFTNGLTVTSSLTVLGSTSISGSTVNSGSYRFYSEQDSAFVATVSGSRSSSDIAFNFRKIGEPTAGSRHTMIVEGTGGQDTNLYFGVNGVGGNPGATFAVKGNGSVNINMPVPTVNYGGLAVGGWISSYPSLLVRGVGSTSSTTSLRVENSSTTTSLVVLDNGNVGIGTSAPSASLQIGDGTTGARTLYIGGAISSDQVVGFNVNNTVYHRILSNANTGEFRLDAGATGGGHYLTVRADGTEQMRVRSTGVGIGTTAPSSKLHVVGNTILSGSAGTGSALYAYKSGSTVVDIQGSQGQLFSVIDALSGSLMSVNDISGLPILEVFSDDRVVMGTYGNAALIVTGSDVQISASLFGTRQTGSLAVGSTLLYTINTGSYTAGFFDYFINSGSNYRAGNIMAVFGAGTYKFTDLATPDIGSTTNLQFSMSMAGASAQLYASASSAGWTVKTTFRTI